MSMGCYDMQWFGGDLRWPGIQLHLLHGTMSMRCYDMQWFSGDLRWPGIQ